MTIDNFARALVHVSRVADDMERWAAKGLRMKHKTAELEGAMLDAAVAKAEGMVAWDHPCGLGPFYGEMRGIAIPAEDWRPSTDWQEGGPIIERERIAVLMLSNEWHAWTPTPTARVSEYDPTYWLFEQTSSLSDAKGPTPLIAAMRAYVASKFGDEVEL